ncbi:hypothetical protein Unana1_01290 [Umbelopsis nana]
MASIPQRHSTLPSIAAGSLDSSTTLLTPEESDAYSQLFKIANKSGSGTVTGAEAIEFFAKSGLSPTVLSEIWDIADEANTGSLNAHAFYVALKLIACQQQGKEPSKPVLSTKVKIPTFDGVSIGVASQRRVDSSKPLIQANEREKFIRIFHASHPENGILDAEKAKRVFSRSKLPVDTLAQIWSLADTRKSGTLNQTEFVVAMYYIARCMEGSTDIPPSLPPAIYAAAAGRTTSASGSPQVRHNVPQIPRQSTGPQAMTASPVQPIARQFTGASSAFSPMLSRANTISPSLPPNSNKWIISPEDRRKFDVFFDKIDVGKLGCIQGADAVEFFQNSRLPDTDLAHIWDLADRHERGRLSKDEFAIAMYLIHKRLKGDLLPTILPPSLLAEATAAERSASTGDNTFPAAATFVQSPPSTTRSLIDDGDQFQKFETQSALKTMASEVENIRENVRLAEQDQAKSNIEHTSLDEQLKSLQTEKTELADRLTHLLDSHKQTKAAVAELKEQLETEREQLRIAQEDAKHATEELDAVQEQKQQIDKEIESNRLESSRLRKDIFAKQEQSNRLRRELEKLGAFIKKDRMMLDITRRQASAADSDVEKLSAALDKAKSGTPIEEVSESIQTSPKLADEPLTSTDLPSSPDAIGRRQGTSQTQRVKAAPPPPPPSSRHHQSTVEEKRSSTIPSGKKPRAPPPAARSKSKTDLSTAATATAVAATGAVAGIALEHVANDGFSNSDPFDDFTRTFEAAKEIDVPADFDEVFGDQPTSSFAPFPEQQSFSTGFDDDFATPASNVNSTQPVAAKAPKDVPEASHAQETPVITPEAPAAAVAQETASDESDSDQTESETETASDSDSADEDDEEDEGEPKTEAVSHVIEDAPSVVALENTSAIPESSATPTAIEHSGFADQSIEGVVDQQVTLHDKPSGFTPDEQETIAEQPMESTTDKVQEESLDSQTEDLGELQREAVSEDISQLPESSLQEESVIQDQIEDQKEFQEVELTAAPTSESLPTTDASTTPKAEEVAPVEAAEPLTSAVEETSTGEILKAQDFTPTDHAVSEETVEERQQEHQPDKQEIAYATVDESESSTTTTALPESSTDVEEPTVDSHAQLDPTDKTSQLEQEEKPDHDFEVIDPVSSTSSFVSDGMTVSMEQEQSPFDDFESAFSGSMSEAKVIPTSSNAEFEAPFDTSFEDEFNPNFDQPQNISSSSADDASSAAVAFADSFNFDNSAFDSALAQNSSTTGGTDLNSAFHVDSPQPESTTAQPGQDSPYLHSGFSSFATALEGTDTPPSTTAPSAVPRTSGETFPPSPTAVAATPDSQHSPLAPNSNPTSVPTESAASHHARSPALSEPSGLQELLNMGFSREQAVDALRRYDNDLEKATNFLLDN